MKGGTSRLPPWISCVPRISCLPDFSGFRKAPSRLWGRGASMQPTPRGSGVWVGQQKDPEPATTQLTPETRKDGRHYCRRSVSSGESTPPYSANHESLRSLRRFLPDNLIPAFAFPAYLRALCGLC